MNHTLHHRGPDGSSCYVNEHVSLGHNRLPIIDLSVAGTQPMFYTAHGREVCIVQNGEIYNYLELKSRLTQLGYAFSSSTDTEVILAAYLEWGEDCVKEFNGMWSFCLYDLREDKLFCSRDRLGVKPFYFYYHNNIFIFSSELKAILKHENLNLNLPGNIQKEAVEFFFSLGYIPAPYTIYRHVSKLQAGSNLVFDLKSATISRMYPYYQLVSSKTKASKDELVEEGKFLFRDAVKLRMRSDVPVGAFLSGGLDSSAVVGEMRHFTQLENLHTFSIGFENKSFDETEYIHLVRQFFGTKHHHHIYLESDFAEGWKYYSDVFDEPFGDYSSFPTYKVCHMAHDHVRVVLSGDGGDEVFGGYPLYNTGSILDWSRRMPEEVRKMLYKVSVRMKGLDNRIAKANEIFKLSLLEKREFHKHLFSQDRYKPAVFSEWSMEKLGNALELTENNLSEALRVYDLLYNTLPDHYLVKVDRTSMSNSIEVRSPFLDYRFMEFAQKIPTPLKVNFRRNKILMREMIKDIVPSGILHRNKMGFTPPIHEWLYNSISASQFETYLAYLKDFSSELFLFYQKLLVSDKKSYMRDLYLIRLAIFGNWIEHWIVRRESHAVPYRMS